MKILLINPSYTSSLALGLSFGEPLGIAYLAAAIEKNANHQVEIFDSVGLATELSKEGESTLFGLKENEIFNLISKKTFDILGISLVSYFPEVLEEITGFIEKLKIKYPNIPIVIGGPAATLSWKSLIKKPYIDYIVLGEGEAAIVELLDAISGEKGIEDVNGIVYKGVDGAVRQNPLREPMNIDQIPWPARHLLPMENYFFKHRSFQYRLRKPAATILTSRACPYQCVFCNLRNIWGREWRGRDPNDVVNEMEHLVNKYGVRRIYINDDNFIANPRRVEKICDIILERKLDVAWTVMPGMAVWLLTKKLLKKMRDSGLFAICAQIETGNKKTVKYINKKIDFEHAKEILKYAGSLGLITNSNIIIGFLHESKEDIKESIRVAENLHLDRIEYLFPIPYEHTPMYDDYIREGIIKKGEVLKIPYRTRFLTPEELVQLKNEAQRNHRKKRLLQLLNPVSFSRELLPKLFLQGRRVIMDFF